MPAVGHYESRGHVEGRGLARSVGSQQPHYLALPYVDAHSVCDSPLAVYFYEVVGAQHHAPSIACFVVFHFFED